MLLTFLSVKFLSYRWTTASSTRERLIAESSRIFFAQSNSAREVTVRVCGHNGHPDYGKQYRRGRDSNGLRDQFVTWLIKDLGHHLPRVEMDVVRGRRAHIWF